MNIEDEFVEIPEMTPEDDFRTDVLDAITKLILARGFDISVEPFPAEAYELMERTVRAFCIHADAETQERFGVGSLRAKLFVMRKGDKTQ